MPDLERLAQEIREEVITTVSKTGGHLASSLGAVELAIALHYVFDTPKDKLIWDVGHQSYAHKLLTGRRDVFHSLRQWGGISGFPRREESPYDTFNTGHSGTSISAALGIATALDFRKDNAKVIAVIGDGSMTAGMAFEALNQAGHLNKDLIVVLNDNEMSISHNVGALSSFLSRKLTGKIVTNFRREIKGLLMSVPAMGEDIVKVVKRAEESLKTFFTPGMLFAALKFEYVGPIRGHRLDRLVEAFKNVKYLERPVLVHVLTTKGKGYGPAESDPTAFHGTGPFDIESGKARSTGKHIKSYTDIFGEAILEFARQDERIIAVTAAMREGTGLTKFREVFPDRFFDVGIAEQHAVTFAAGMATQGLRPVVAIYSTFLQRAYDQVLHDVCLQRLPVVFALDRAGIAGEDGPTHQGLFDLSYMRHLPNMVVMAPKDENELRRMLKTAIEHSGPICLRYPRGASCGVELDAEVDVLSIGEAELLREGDDILIIAIGSTVYPALEAAQRLSQAYIEASVINARFVKPLDISLIRIWAKRTGRVVTVEENVREGGFGSAVLESLGENNITNIRINRIGIPDVFVEHGGQEILRKKYGLDAESIFKAAQQMVSGGEEK
jgi:1-deoxy-D-xylulose-5-phosphate synthase